MNEILRGYMHHFMWILYSNFSLKIEKLGIGHKFIQRTCVSKKGKMDKQVLWLQDLIDKCILIMQYLYKAAMELYIVVNFSYALSTWKNDLFLLN